MMMHQDEAKALGISGSYWSLIRRGIKIPSLKLAVKIEKMFPDYKVVDLIPTVRKIVKKSIRV